MRVCIIKMLEWKLKCWRRMIFDLQPEVDELATRQRRVLTLPALPGEWGLGDRFRFFVNLLAVFSPMSAVFLPMSAALLPMSALFVPISLKMPNQHISGPERSVDLGDQECIPGNLIMSSPGSAYFWLVLHFSKLLQDNYLLFSEQNDNDLTMFCVLNPSNFNFFRWLWTPDKSYRSGFITKKNIF